MATKRKSGGSQGGSTLYGVLAGLLIGLVLAAAVAFYVTKAPVPFVDRATRQGSATERPMDPRTAPDPNLGLYGRDGAAGLPPTGPTATAPVPLPSNPKQPVDDLGALIATLPSQSREAPAPAAAPTPSGTQAATPPAAPKAAAKPAPEKLASAAPAPAAASGSYYLQAGAFRTSGDAESVRARILLLGLPANVQRATVSGTEWNRVRVGPFAKLDEMNRARSRLAAEKIESTVVKQQ